MITIGGAIPRTALTLIHFIMRNFRLNLVLAYKKCYNVGTKEALKNINCTNKFIGYYPDELKLIEDFFIMAGKAIPQGVDFERAKYVILKNTSNHKGFYFYNF